MEGEINEEVGQGTEVPKKKRIAKPRPGLGIKMAYRERSGTLFVIKGALGGLKAMRSKGIASQSLSDEEVTLLDAAIESLQVLSDKSHDTYFNSLKPLFVQKAEDIKNAANEAKSQSAGPGSGPEQQNDNRTVQESSDDIGPGNDTNGPERGAESV